jgi:hypothetical protein
LGHKLFPQSDDLSEEDEDEFEYEMTEEERLEAAFDAKHMSIGLSHIFHSAICNFNQC